MGICLYVSVDVDVDVIVELGVWCNLRAKSSTDCRILRDSFISPHSPLS
jgi:hypothetical protein